MCKTHSKVIGKSKKYKIKWQQMKREQNVVAASIIGYIVPLLNMLFISDVLWEPFTPSVRTFDRNNSATHTAIALAAF